MNTSRYYFLKLRKYNRNIPACTARTLAGYTCVYQKYAPTELENAYNPEIVESGRYSKWENEKRFTLCEKESGPMFSLVLPPPNVTGSLHLGHALTTTLQDVLSRWKRMRGFEVCWLPGTDHAGIATQAVVEKYLSKKGITRHSLGREKFELEVWKWKNKYGGRIKEQLKMLGASLDWSREVFTMDERQTVAVRKAFIDLFNEGLIYRANHLVNWSCSLQSTISDIEVDDLEIIGPTDIDVPGYSRPIKFGLMTEFAYKLQNSDAEIVVATTRPETILGDVAVAVHPEDPRYSQFIGCKVAHPFLPKFLPVIPDEYVDREFGTGALKITPAHDHHDYAIAKRHNLPLECVVNESGKIRSECILFSGMKRYDARDAIMQQLEEKQLLRAVKPHSMSIPVCSRSSDIIELLPLPQWYIDCKKMAAKALQSLENGNLTFFPENFNTVWNKWLAEERDWCVSRQLWWGHHIPAYKCYDKNSPNDFLWVAAENLDKAKEIAAKSFTTDVNNLVCEPDEDVLDTWFSSGLYPFSSWGWPQQTKDLQRFYPLSLMITGHDILRFWVCRMVMLGDKLTGSLPFAKVLLHGIICDSNGSKMSKSKGNVIDPEDVIKGISLHELNVKTLKSYENGAISKTECLRTLEIQKKKFPEGIPRCGADALRFTLCRKNVTGHFINFDVEDCHTNQLFGNKIWQSMKYWRNANELSLESGALEKCQVGDLAPIDLWILSRLSYMVQEVNNSLEDFRFHTATAALKQFFYSEVCDVYVECTKMNLRFHSESEVKSKALAAHCHTFSVCFNTALRCLAPFMPFLVDELIPAIPMKHNCTSIVYNDEIKNLVFPDSKDLLRWRNHELDNTVEFMLDIVSTVRQLKSTFDISNKIHPSIYIESSNKQLENVVSNYGSLINFLCRCNKTLLKDSTGVTADIWSFTSDGASKVHLEIPNANDHLKAGAAKLIKKKEKLKKRLNKMEAYLNIDKYEENTPQQVKDSNSEKIRILKQELKKLESFQIKI